MKRWWIVAGAAATVATAPLVAQGGGRETAVFAGGCFWGVDAVFRHVHADSIVTEVVPLRRFYAAEAYHQEYLARHRDQPYIVYNDLPKLGALKQKFPELYRP